jgi:hypothetical protein
VDEFKLRVQGISTTADASRDQMAGAVLKPGAAKPGAARPAAPPPKPPEITRFGS